MFGSCASDPQHNHDIEQDQAAWPASMDWAVNLPSECDLNLPKGANTPACATPSMSSRLFSPRPSPQKCVHSTKFVSREETLEHVRTRDRSTTSLAKSSRRSLSVTDLSHSPLISAHSINKMSSDPSQPIKSMSESVPLTTNSMTPRTRKKLQRSTRKLSKVLGETPVLSTALEARDTRLDSFDAEMGMLSPSPIVNGASLKRKDSTQKRRFVKPGMSLGLGGRLGNIPDVPFVDADFSPRPAVSSTLPSAFGRAPPVLKVDCSSVAGKGKRPRQGSSPESGNNADVQSFISTTTSTFDLFSPSGSRGSPNSPMSTISAFREKAKSNEREVRRTKMAKLARHLGESVPAELLFRSDVPLASQTPLPNDTNVSMVGPPRRSSLVNGRKRMSLQLDLYQKPDTPASKPAFVSDTASRKNVAATPASTPVKNRSGRNVLLRSRSLRERTGTELYSPANTRPRSGRARTAEPEKISAPLFVDVIIKQARNDPQLQVNQETEPVVGVLEVLEEPRVQLSDRQRALYVRRAMKMAQVFGATPPKALWGASMSMRDGLMIPKRHSIHSIITTASTQEATRSRAASDASTMLLGIPVHSPVTPTTTRMNESGSEGNESAMAERSPPGSQEAASNIRPANAEASKTPQSSPRTVRRHSSLSALPPTPPPFSRYFAPPTPPADPALRINTHHRLQGPYTPITFSMPRSERSPLSSPLSPSLPSPSPFSKTSYVSISPEVYEDGRQRASANMDPSFRERRLRAAKLARFFGVGYGDLFPSLDEDAEGATEPVDRKNSRSPDAVSSPATRSTGLSHGASRSLDNYHYTLRRERTGAGVSASASEPGHGRPSTSSSRDSRLSARPGSPARADALKGVSVSVQREVNASPRRGGAGSPKWGAGLSVSMNGRRRGFGLGLVRKDSAASRARAVAGGGADVGGAPEAEPALVRVGEAEADVLEVMGRLRELR